MGILHTAFGPGKDEIWSKIAADIGGDYINGGFWGKDELRYQYLQWEILLDTYTVRSKNSSTTYTRMRAPFINKDGFYFKIYREGIFSSIGKLFGMQDIQICDPFFDEQYIIKSNSEDKVRRLFASEKLKQLINKQPQISLEIRDDEGWFGQHFPDGTDELYFSCVGIIKDTYVLKALFDTFALTLELLVDMDSAYALPADMTLN